MFFICSTVCAWGYLGHLELVCFCCLSVSQVACHPVSIGPCIRVARTTTLQSELAHVGWIVTSVSPPKPSSVPDKNHISGIPGWAQKKLQDHRGLVLQLEAVSLHDHLLNSQSGGSIRLMSTFSQVGSVPTSVKESVAGRWMDLQLTVDKMWLTQAKLFLNFLAWAFAPKLNEPIWSFNSWPLFSCQWLQDWVTYQHCAQQWVLLLGFSPISNMHLYKCTACSNDQNLHRCGDTSFLWKGTHQPYWTTRLAI